MPPPSPPAPLPPAGEGRKTWLRRAFITVLALFILLFGLDRLFPLPAPGRDSFNVTVVARDGTPLRAFPDSKHIWRYPVTLEDVSPLYVQTLIDYEDKYFWLHPGINPVSLFRAAYQWVRYGDIISGGSTLTMQVARMLEPTPRTVAGKLKQILRALQLEFHFSKKDILTMYINFAPMGGVLEGVETASRAYLGKPAKRLTHAEAALLTVLPQQPSRLRPDRYPHKAHQARDKVIERMQDVWSAANINDALSEPIAVLSIKEPMLAPLFAQRMKKRYAGPLRIDTTLQPQAQQTVENLLLDRVRLLPPHMSMAAMIMDNDNAEVLAYAGSADFNDNDRFSHVDMVRASRSPGSTLKPFLYAFALDEGLIHSESLLSDTPQAFSGYQPGNFQQNFHGPVSVSEALAMSLNVPAVQVLDQLGAPQFVAMLRRGGLALDFPKGATPNLSVILGGAGTSLEALVSAYSALARKGMTVTPRFTPTDPIHERRMMSEGAAFIVRDILETPSNVAYKTGTSFGFRDAWSVGVTDRYTVGVWVGRPDGTPNPGFFGANIAAPLLLDIVNALPEPHQFNQRTQPATVRQEKICWPSGTRVSDNIGGQFDQLCPVQRTAWILNDIAPPTLPDPQHTSTARLTYYVDVQSGKRVLPECALHAYQSIQAARWPSALTPWLDADLRRKSLPPEWNVRCKVAYNDGTTLRIVGLRNNEIIRQANGHALPTAKLEVRGAQGDIYWMLNGRLLTGNGMNQRITFQASGRYDITAFDQHGNYDRVTVRVGEEPEISGQ